MLKFLNRNKNSGVEREIRISITSVQGGATIEVTMEEGGKTIEENILLTPMDVACFVYSSRYGENHTFMPVGHGKDGADIRARSLMIEYPEWDFVGGPEDAEIRAGNIVFVVPSFVINAMRIALENMMESMMYPTTGDMEEEFG